MISWFVSTRTSPVSASTTRPPVRRPTSDSARTGILVMPASTSFSMIFGFSVLPAWTIGFLGAGRLHVVADLGRVVDLGGELHPGHPVLEGEHLLRLVELAEDLLVGEDHALLEEPEGAQEGGGEHLAPPVHPHVEDVVGVELELHPRAAVGDHPGREEQLARGDRLALVVVEEHTRRALELRDDHPLGPVDDEGALLGHERELAQVHLLLPHLAHGLGLGFLVVVDDLEPQRDLQRDREGHAPVVALLHRVLGIAEVVAVELEHGVPVVVLDREHRLEDRLQPRLVAPLGRDLLLQKLLVGLLLDLDEIRDLDDGRDLTEVLADPAPALDVARHTPSAPRYRGAGFDPPPSRTPGSPEPRPATTRWCERGTDTDSPV